MVYRRILETFFLASLWGPSFLFNKLAVSDIAPITLVSLRVGLGGLILLLVLKLKGLAFTRDPKLLFHSLILGFFCNGFPFVCYSYSIVYIPTSLSALINGLVPIFTVLLANLWLEDEKISWNKVIGIGFGFSGILITFLPKLFQQDVNISWMGNEVKGMVLALSGSISYAIGMVYTRRYIKNAPMLVVPSLQLLTPLIYLIPLAWFLEGPQDLMNASLSSWLAVLGLAVLGTALAFVMYHRIVSRYGATALSMVSYLLPVLGTLLGVLFLGESISFSFVIAAALILGGILVINGYQPRRVLVVE